MRTLVFSVQWPSDVPGQVVILTLLLAQHLILRCGEVSLDEVARGIVFGLYYPPEPCHVPV